VWENKYRNECFLQGVERIMIREIELSGNVLPGEMSQ